jgi:hypothetical protein
MKIYTAGKIEIVFIPWDNWDFRKVPKHKLKSTILPKLKEMGDFRLPDAAEINYICRELHEKLGVGGFYKGAYWYGLPEENGGDTSYVPLSVSTYWLDDSGRNFDRYEEENMLDLMTVGAVIGVRNI